MKNFFAKFWAGCQAVWKAIGAGVVAAVIYIVGAGILSLDIPVWEALVKAWGELGQWTGHQWLGLIAAIAAAYGVVWVIPNKPS